MDHGEGKEFCAFTSSSTDFRHACAMVCFSVGTILEFTLLEGFQLDDVSLYPRESEVLLPPEQALRRVLGGANDEDRVFAGRRGLLKHVPRNANSPRNITLQT